MTSTDNTSKPLKTVEEILYSMADDLKRGFVHSSVIEAKAQLNNHYKELVLSIIGKIDFDTASKNMTEYNQIAKVKAMGYCYLCGHDPKQFRDWLEQELAKELNHKKED